MTEGYGHLPKGPSTQNRPSTQSIRYGGPICRRPFFSPFFCALFVVAQERKKEKRKERQKEATRTWRESRTLSPKRSAGLQNPEPEKECWVARP